MTQNLGITSLEKSNMAPRNENLSFFYFENKTIKEKLSNFDSKSRVKVFGKSNMVLQK